MLGHARSIAFENIDPFLRRPVRLDLESLQAKLVAARRGGWCFEHNLLLAAVLDTLGFRTTGLLAAVVWGRPVGPPPPLGHMVVLVDLPEGPHVVDVGFGGLTPTGALRLEPGGTQATPHEPFRLTADGDEYVVEVDVGGRWQALYRFSLVARSPADFEAANRRVGTEIGSYFLTGLVAARPADGRRYALRGRELAVHHVGGRSERRVAGSPGELLEALERDFLVDLSGVPELEAALARAW